MNWLITSAIIFVPIVLIVMEIAASILSHSRKHLYCNEQNENYQMLVPIWGDIKYLENIEYLSKYGTHVVLCTTGNESKNFYVALDILAQKYNFKIFRDEPNCRVGKKPRLDSNQRTTSGSMRDTIIRNALNEVTTPFVVTLDADSTTVRDISFLVGELKIRGLDIASIRIEPSNGRASILARLQTFEYDVAMNLRLLYPWLISGACHTAKTEVLKDIMSKHSLFFQGNDVEIGLLAKTLGYKVGHIPFVVLTAVPEKSRAWFRQRLAWAGGEFRLFVINFKFIMKHPLFWFYGALVTICMFPLRWAAFCSSSFRLYIILGLYVGFIIFLHWKKRNPWLILMPIYTLFISLVVTPLGVVWYFYMAYKDKNYGIIDYKR